MALNADTLGQALYDVRQAYSNKTVAQLEQEHGSMNAARLSLAKAEAAAIIAHFRSNADGLYQAASLVAGQVPVTPALPVAIKLN